LDSGKSAKEIAEALDKTPATIYSHIANIRKDRGDTEPRKRGRPPKAKTEGESNGKSEGTPRPRPAVTKASGEKPAPKSEKASASNGHDALKSASRFPIIHAAIEQELAEARKKVAVLEKMLETV
jgi:predicted ArsR family transcriptional regulator